MDSSLTSELSLPATADDNKNIDVAARFTEASAFYKKGLYKQSETIFRDLIGLNSNFVEAHINLGNCLFKQKNYNEAISSWKKALSIDSANIICYSHIGNALYASGKSEEAIANWQHAIIAAPDHLQTLLNLASAYENTGHASEAFKYYEQYLKYSINQSTSEYSKVFNKVTYSKKVAIHNLKAGIIFQKRNNLRKAAICYMKSIEAYPNYPKAHLNMGSICYLAEKFDHAVKYWLQSVKLDPSYPVTYFNLGIAYDRLKQFSYAFCMYQRFAQNSKGGINREVTSRIETLKAYVSARPEMAKEHLGKAEEFFKKTLYYDSIWEYENFSILKPDQADNYKTKIDELKTIIDPVKKASKLAFDAANKALKDNALDKAVLGFKKYLSLEPSGEFALLARKKMLECIHIQKSAKKNERIK